MMSGELTAGGMVPPKNLDHLEGVLPSPSGLASSETPQAQAVIDPEPPIAARLFGERIGLARAFAADLSRRGEVLGLIGPLERTRLWSRHVINSVLLAPLLHSGGRVGDIGSGAGLPGIVLAIARPDVQFVLIEPMERRVDWLLEQVRNLGLANVEVIRARAEDVVPQPPLDQITARAVSAVAKLLPLAVDLVRVGGELLLMKGASVEAEIAAASKVIRRLGLTEVETVVLGDGVETETTRVFRAKVGQ